MIIQEYEKYQVLKQKDMWLSLLSILPVAFLVLNPLPVRVCGNFLEMIIISKIQ